MAERAQRFAIDPGAVHVCAPFCQLPTTSEVRDAFGLAVDLCLCCPTPASDVQRSAPFQGKENGRRLSCVPHALSGGRMQECNASQKESSDSAIILLAAANQLAISAESDGST